MNRKPGWSPGLPRNAEAVQSPALREYFQPTQVQLENSGLRVTGASKRQLKPAMRILIDVISSGSTKVPLGSNGTPQMIGKSYQATQPIWIDVLRPRISERKPEQRAPSQEPPGMAAVMPPWTLDDGLRQLPNSLLPCSLNLHRYPFIEMMALMEEILKPKRPPPITAVAAMK